ncbi:MAG: hypothetical protein JRI59_09120 [Deltaproteobacteria bacterium]|nr:hypothetical protein [Deltaproteobacteria bacterium]
MSCEKPDFTGARLEECHLPSPVVGVKFVPDDAKVIYPSSLSRVRSCLDAGLEPPSLELAGPQKRIRVLAATGQPPNLR